VQLPKHPTDVVIHEGEAEADDRWSFVQKKTNQPWIWIAMDGSNSR
jgi:hypothetical protein